MYVCMYDSSTPIGLFFVVLTALTVLAMVSYEMLALGLVST